MQPSPAIREIQLRDFQFFWNGDITSEMADWSHEPGVMVIGTDPSEWVTTWAAIEEMSRAASANRRSRPMPDDLEIVAYEEGTVGWANMRYTSKLPDGGSFLSRWTVIYHQEGGQWKGISGHVSIGVPDGKVMTWFSPS